MLHGDAQGVTRLRGQRPEVAPAPPDLAVERLKRSRGERQRRPVELGERLVASPVPPAARRGEAFEAQGEPRDSLVACEPRHSRVASGRPRLGRIAQPVEARLVGEPRERALAEPLDEHVPVARFAKQRGDPFRIPPATPRIPHEGRRGQTG